HHFVEALGLEGRHRSEPEALAEQAVGVVHARLTGVAEGDQLAGFRVAAGNGVGKEAGTASRADEGISLAHCRSSSMLSRRGVDGLLNAEDGAPRRRFSIRHYADG